MTVSISLGKQPPTKVFVLVIDNAGGISTQVASTYAKVSALLLDYVQENWNIDGPGTEGKTMHVNADVAIEEYFEWMEDESYAISEVEVQA